MHRSAKAKEHAETVVVRFLDARTEPSSRSWRIFGRSLVNGRGSCRATAAYVTPRGSEGCSCSTAAARRGRSVAGEGTTTRGVSQASTRVGNPRERAASERRERGACRRRRRGVDIPRRSFRCWGRQRWRRVGVSGQSSVRSARRGSTLTRNRKISELGCHRAHLDARGGGACDAAARNSRGDTRSCAFGRVSRQLDSAHRRERKCADTNSRDLSMSSLRRQVSLSRTGDWML